jgi:mRNA-degrading endonuclease RelE of RelBE toxin-antitoxin system
LIRKSRGAFSGRSKGSSRIPVRPSGVVKLEGASDLWRIRVGDWRVVYSISDRNRLVDVVTVRHRRDVYR